MQKNKVLLNSQYCPRV